MHAPSDMKASLRSLSISKEQRPAGSRASRRSRKGYVFALLLLAAAGAGYAYRDRVIPAARELVASAREPAATPLFHVVLTGEPQAPPVLTATGKIVSDHRVAVATKVSGQIVSLHFEQGDRVKEGQVLARIEDVLYRARRDEAAARLERSKAALAYQTINYERVAGLLKSQDAPDIEHADALRWYQEAQAQVAADGATLDFAQKTLDDCEVSAPIAGVILMRNVEIGDFVAAEGGRGANANAQFAVIADMSKLRVEVDVSELDILRIRKDMYCVVTPDAYKDRRYDGFVMWIDPGANYSKATVQAKVRIEDPDDYLRIEGSAQVAFFAERPAEVKAVETKALWIPASACVMDESGGVGHVFAVVDGRFRRTKVSVGRKNGSQVEVLSGLSPGQSIAADQLETISEGQRIPG